jgi:ABC-type Fe3+-hydroxamate transport system substrate-binding protein
MRIVSTVPSLTETLFDWGLGDSIVGVTDYCIYPKEALNRVDSVGGPKTLDVIKIASLEPDLILAVEEENSKEQIEFLTKHFNVECYKVESVADAFDMLLHLGTKLNCFLKGSGLVSDIQDRINKISKEGNLVKTACMIWKQPWMAVGANTYPNDLLELCGFENQVAKSNRYPVFDMPKLKQLELDCLLLPNEPYEFGSDDVIELQQELRVPCLLVDGTYLFWYGSRLLKSIDYLISIREQLGSE